MPEDKNDLQNRLEEIDQQSQDQELARIYKLSQKKMTTATTLSLLLPIGGYIYTARWKAFFILLSLLVGMITITTINEQNEKKIDRMTKIWGIVASMVAAIDNSIAIHSAREKINSMK